MTQHNSKESRTVTVSDHDFIISVIFRNVSLLIKDTIVYICDINRLAKYF